MESYIPHTFFNTKAKKIWFNSACSRAVKDRGTAHKQYRSHASAETHAIYISSRNHAKPILQLTKNSFINSQQQSFLLMISGIQPIISPTILLLHLSLLYYNQMVPQLSLFFSKAEVFAQTFTIKSTLDDTGYISPTPSPSDYFIPKIKILHNDVFHALSGLDSRRA